MLMTHYQMVDEYTKRHMTLEGEVSDDKSAEPSSSSASSMDSVTPPPLKKAKVNKVSYTHTNTHYIHIYNIF